MKLNEEERELIREAVQSEFWPALVRAMEIGLNHQTIHLLNISTKEGKDEVFVRKAKHEGAKELKTYFENLKKEFRGRSDG